MIVSTPQQVAVADVVRGVEMFRNENVNIPVAGVIENMAWFTPEELPENRYYIFGKGARAVTPKRTAWIFWAKYPSYSPSWRVPTRDALRRASIRGSKNGTAKSPKRLSKR